MTVVKSITVEDLQAVTERDPMFRVLAIVNGPVEISEVKPGYFLAPLGMDNILRQAIDEQMPSIGKLHWTAVVDTPEQFIEAYGELFENDPRTFIVFFTPIVKANQSPSGGWRWHKWGEYLGSKSPQHEYLYDEGPEFESVYVVMFSTLKEF